MATADMGIHSPRNTNLSVCCTKLKNSISVTDPNFMMKEEEHLEKLIEAGEEFDYKIPNARIVVVHESIFQDTKRMEVAKRHLIRNGKTGS